MEDKFSAVILAAGTSSRTTEWKPGTLLGDQSILFRSVSAALSLCSEIVVVGGYNYNVLKSLISTFHPSPSEQGYDSIEVKCIENINYKAGMFSSVRTGIKEVTNENVFIALADMPFVTGEVYKKLAAFFEMHKEEYDVISPANVLNSGRDKKGHPVLINAAVKNRILNGSNEEILRDVLKEFRTVKCIVDDEGINFDIDTDEDLEKAKQLLNMKED